MRLLALKLSLINRKASKSNLLQSRSSSPRVRKRQQARKSQNQKWTAQKPSEKSASFQLEIHYLKALSTRTECLISSTIGA